MCSLVERLDLRVVLNAAVYTSLPPSTAANLIQQSTFSKATSINTKWEEGEVLRNEDWGERGGAQ